MPQDMLIEPLSSVIAVALLVSVPCALWLAYALGFWRGALAGDAAADAERAALAAQVRDALRSYTLPPVRRAEG